MEMENKTTKQKIFDFLEKHYLWVYLGLLAMLAFCCFFKLGTAPIKSYDEARHGVNAYEMIKNNNYVANFYAGSPDYWNLKPPMSYWVVILGYKIFGYNAWGLRFFSALSYFLTALIVSLFLKKRYGKLESLISVLVFMSCYFFFFNHFVRTGDADAVFVLFYTIALISLFKSSENANYLYLCGLMFSFCFLTKSWHAMILVPTVFFYLLLTKGFKKIKWWQLVLFFVISLIPIALWIAWRHTYDGFKFLEGMVFYDLLKRSSSVIEDNGGTNLFYVYHLVINAGMAVLFVISNIWATIKVDKKEKFGKLDILCAVAFFSVVVIYFASKTKLYWYIYPLFVPLGIFGTKAFVEFLRKDNLKKIANAGLVFSMVAICVSCLISFVYPCTLKKSDKLQNFIAEMEIAENSDVYIYDNGSDYWSQAALLCTELYTNCNSRDGGIKAFKNNKQGYLVIDKSSYAGLNLSRVEIDYENEYYVLCSFEE